MFRRGKWIGAIVLAIAASCAGTAFAAGAGTETLTEHERGVTLFEKKTTNPCTGEVGTLVAVAKNSKFHITTQADGNAWVTGTTNGTVTFTPLEPGGVSYAGHFTNWFGESNNNKNEVGHATGTNVLTGTDGSTLHLKTSSHFSTNAKGEVKVESEIREFRCG